MKKTHKTLYMILAVLLISFLFFGSRKEEVVEGFQEGFKPMKMLTVLKKGKKCRENEANEGWEKIFTAWGTSEGAVTYSRQSGAARVRHETRRRREDCEYNHRGGWRCKEGC